MEAEREEKMEEKRLHELAFAVITMKLSEQRLPIVNNQLQNEFKKLQQKHGITADEMKSFLFTVWNRLSGEVIVEVKEPEVQVAKKVAYFSLLENMFASPMSFGERSAKDLGQAKKQLQEMGFVFSEAELKEAYEHFRAKWFEEQKKRLEKLIK